VNELLSYFNLQKILVVVAAVVVVVTGVWFDHKLLEVYATNDFTIFRRWQ